MTLYIILIIDPENYIDVDVCFSKIQAENIILEYKRWPGYAGYQYEIKETYIDGIMEIR